MTQPQSLQSSMATYLAEPRDDAAWELDYALCLVENPISVGTPPRSVEWAGGEGERRRSEGPNLYARFRADQRADREAGAMSARPGGWDAAASNRAFQVERSGWDQWYNPIDDRFREISKSLRGLNIHRPDNWRDLCMDLIDQGDRLREPLVGWTRSGIIPWLPAVQGEKYPSILHAWQHCASSWRTELGRAAA